METEIVHIAPQQSSHPRGNNNEIRILLLGKTGNGKSATGNSILLHNFFKSELGASSITQVCCKGQANVYGRNIQIVDTPGMCDTINPNDPNDPNDLVLKNITESMVNISPGPHCFLLVLASCRFTEEDEKTIHILRNIFGENLFRYSIIIFTRKDDLDYEKKTLEDYLVTAPESLKKIIAYCNDRCVAINNRAPEKENEEQVKAILKIMDDLIDNNDGSAYTNSMFKVMEQMMTEYELEQMMTPHELEQMMIEFELNDQTLKPEYDHRNHIERMVGDLKDEMQALESDKKKLRECNSAMMKEIENLDETNGMMIQDAQSTSLGHKYRLKKMLERSLETGTEIKRRHANLASKVEEWKKINEDYFDNDKHFKKMLNALEKALNKQKKTRFDLKNGDELLEKEILRGLIKVVKVASLGLLTLIFV